MSEEIRDQVASGEAGFSALPSVGSQLKAAREARQMSVADIALALKLGSRQVEALESGNWQGLPGHTFIRGFVRNYARLLRLDPSPLMAQLDAILELPQQRLSLPGKARATMPHAGRRPRHDHLLAWSGLAVLALALGIYFLLPADLSSWRGKLESALGVFARKEAPPAPPPPAEPLFPPGTTPQQVMNPQEAASGETSAAPPAATPSAATPAASAPAALVPPPVLPPESAAPAQPAPATAADNKLHFVFELDSWVEARDRNGKVLFSQRNLAGTEQSIDGQGPFSLVIGNAKGVKLTWRGQPVDLARYTRSEVARLTLE